MGSPLSPIIANIYMEHFEKIIVDTLCSSVGMLMILLWFGRTHKLTHPCSLPTSPQWDPTIDPICDGGRAKPTDCIPICPGEERGKQTWHICLPQKGTHHEISELSLIPPPKDIRGCSEDPEIPCTEHLRAKQAGGRITTLQKSFSMKWILRESDRPNNEKEAPHSET